MHRSSDTMGAIAAALAKAQAELTNPEKSLTAAITVPGATPCSRWSESPARTISMRLARISHTTKCIGAPNQRKLLWHNDFRAIRGAPRCRQSVAQICSDLHPLKDAKL